MQHKFRSTENSTDYMKLQNFHELLVDQKLYKHFLINSHFGTEFLMRRGTFQCQESRNSQTYTSAHIIFRK